MRLGGREITYEKSQLVEVICQLRFPAILSIDSKVPADFQERIRQDFPRYMAREEKLPGQGGGKNHSFVSLDGAHRITLTAGFFAFSSIQYAGYKDFARWMDEPLGHFVSIYQPACFERVGLRYLNAFSREKLGLQGVPWSELIAPQYLGALTLPGAEEERFTRSQVEGDWRLDEQCAVKLHAGPGLVQRNVRTAAGVQRVQDPEAKFIFDIDLYSAGRHPLSDAPTLIDRLHEHADALFAGAVTDKLHEAMEPVYVM